MDSYEKKSSCIGIITRSKVLTINYVGKEKSKDESNFKKYNV